MDLSPSGLLAHARSPEGRKKLRYVAVSVVFVPIGQVMVVALGLALGSYTAASILTAAILTLPNFYANKLWVWKLTSKESQRTQILVFWVAAMLGVCFATGLTFVAERLTTDLSKVMRSLVVVAFQLTGYGIVWVLRFLLLDRWLFKVTNHGDEPEPEEIEDLHHEFPI